MDICVVRVRLVRILELQEKCNHPNITIRDITLFLHFVDLVESGVKPNST